MAAFVYLTMDKNSKEKKEISASTNGVLLLK
jgi:hypothetical protein